jgi:hypothetical protein
MQVSLSAAAPPTGLVIGLIIPDVKGYVKEAENGRGIKK